MKIPTDVIRVIRTYLPLEKSHELRVLNRELQTFSRYELEQLYRNYTLASVIFNNDITGTNYLLTKDWTSDEYGQALVAAATRGNLALVEDFIDSNADLMFYGELALERAAQRGHLEILKYILYYYRPLDIFALSRTALERGQELIYEYLSNLGAHIQPTEELYAAVIAGDLAKVKVLLERNYYNKSVLLNALESAILTHHFVIADYLISKGVPIRALSNINIPDRFVRRYLLEYQD